MITCYRPELKQDAYEESLQRITGIQSMHSATDKGSSSLNPVAKDIKKLEKKLIQIRKLKEIRRNGKALEQTQVRYRFLFRRWSVRHHFKGKHFFCFSPWTIFEASLMPVVYVRLLNFSSMLNVILLLCNMAPSL